MKNLKKPNGRNNVKAAPCFKNWKHVMEMMGVALFKEFKESNPGVQISFSMFSKLKPRYIRPNTIHETCCYRYHIEFQLYYDTFVDFCKKHWDGELAPHTVQDFISMILCNRNTENVFFNKRFVGGIRCHECGDLALFHRKFSIDPTHPGLSNIIVK